MIRYECSDKSICAMNLFIAQVDFYLLRERREHDSIWHILIVDMPEA